jgi:RHS repeat-associated protein
MARRQGGLSCQARRGNVFCSIACGRAWLRCCRPSPAIPKPANLAEGLLVKYDAWNRLAGVTTEASVNVVGYQYDGLNRRIIETSYNSGGGLVETRHLYYSNQWQVLEERVDAATTAKAQYIWGLRYIDDLVLRDRNTSGTGLNERLYAMQDANWNTVAICNVSGAVQERFGYTPYGVVGFFNSSWNLNSASTFAWFYLHQGLRLLVVSNLVDNRRRWYSLLLGRFVSIDPVGFVAGDMNLFGYVNCNPVNSLDPFGLLEFNGEITIVDVTPKGKAVNTQLAAEFYFAVVDAPPGTAEIKIYYKEQLPNGQFGEEKVVTISMLKTDGDKKLCKIEKTPEGKEKLVPTFKQRIELPLNKTYEFRTVVYFNGQKNPDKDYARKSFKMDPKCVGKPVWLFGQGNGPKAGGDNIPC